MAAFTVFAQQDRVAGQYISPTVNYNGKGSIVDFRAQSLNWLATSGVQVTLRAEESFDQGSTWLLAFATGALSPRVAPNGQFLGGGFEVYDDFGPRQVRAVLILSASLNIGITGSTT